jgi:hypothetical protein
MFRAKIPHFTSKIVEHSRHLPSRDASEKVVNKPLLNRSERFLLAITSPLFPSRSYQG